MTIIINEDYRNDKDTSRVIKFYVLEREIGKDLAKSFSYIYDSETDEVEFSFIKPETGNLGNINIYYTINNREIPVRGTEEKNLAATLRFNGNIYSSTIIARIPAFKKLIREVYEDNKSPIGLISPGDYNPTLGSNFYKDSNDNSYVTRDTYEDYVRSSNIVGHPLDEVGRKQIKSEEYYKILKTLKIKCNALETRDHINTDGNYYSSDQDVSAYTVYGIYTYDLYDNNRNLINENVLEVTSKITLIDSDGYRVTTSKKRPDGTTVNIPAPPGILPLPETTIESYKRTYFGRLYYEDFDGVIQYIQSENYITLERFIAAEFGAEEGTSIYYEGGYKLFILGPNKGDTVSFSIQLNKDEEGKYPGQTLMELDPELYSPRVWSSFTNPEYIRLFDKDITYDPLLGKLYVTIIAKDFNDEDDPWRPSYAKVLPSLELTKIRIFVGYEQSIAVLDLPYYVIQKSSKVGIIPKKYESRESTTPIDLKRSEEGKYILPISGGIGIKLAYLGITSEVDPYDKDVVRSWSIHEDMSYMDDEGNIKRKERSYFFENYVGDFGEKIVFITGAYDGTLPDFKIRDYIKRDAAWRRAIYESEVTITPIVDNTDKTVDLGGGWSYTLDTATNYFIGSDLLYLFNKENRYKTQRFNLEFKTPPNTGPSYSNFRATINGFDIMGGTNNSSVTDEDGLVYTYFDNYEDIYSQLYGTTGTYRILKDVEKDSTSNIEILKKDDHTVIEEMKKNDQPLYIQVIQDVDNTVNSSWAINWESGIYLCVTNKDTGFPAFYLDSETGRYERLRSRGNTPLFICSTTERTLDNEDYVIEELDSDTNEVISRKYPCVVKNNPSTIDDIDLSSYKTAYPAFKVSYIPFVDKYQTLISISDNNSLRKTIFFAFENINVTDKIVKFDIIYPQSPEIKTTDIDRIPTQSPLRFAFRLIETGANWEYQEIRFYCGLEGIQPLKLLAENNTLYPETESIEYPEIELTKAINKFEVISETYSDIYPDWDIISAYDTFEYSAPEGNNILILGPEDNMNFEPGESYLQVDATERIQSGGSDIIDIIRTKSGEQNWWNDWRFFIYNKITNRFLLNYSSESPDLSITDSENNPIKNIKLDKIGLYRLHISTSLNNANSGQLEISQTSSSIQLYLTDIDNDGWGTTNDVIDPDKLIPGHIRRSSVLTSTPTQIRTVSSSGQNNTSFVVYLWYEGCLSNKEALGRLIVKLTLDAGEDERSYEKSITLTQSPKTGGGSFNNIEDPLSINNFFNFESYRISRSGDELIETPSNLFSERKFPISGAQYGIPIFNGIPGRISIINANTDFPYKFDLTIGGNNENNFLESSENCVIDSPGNLTTGDGIVEETGGCYLIGSFRSYSYNFQTKSYKKYGDEVNNKSKMSWTISFTDSRNEIISSTIHYYSPIDITKFLLNSPGTHSSSPKSLTGVDDSFDFLVNGGYALGDNNNTDPSNTNTFYYEYKSDNIQELTYPNNPAKDRLTITGANLEFIRKASGTTQTLSNNINSYSDGLLSLVKNSSNIFEAIKFTEISDHTFNLQFYNDSDVLGGNRKSSNIPLELLNLFTSLTDEQKSIRWVTTSKMKLQLTMKLPTAMGKEMNDDDFSKMITNSTEDPNYPSESLWYGLGQEFSNEITLVDDVKYVQSSTSDGRSHLGNVNPSFIIPRGKFNNTIPDHSIKIKLTDSTYKVENLFSEFKLYEKGDSSQSISNTFSVNTTNHVITISFSKSLTKDIVLEPKYTNIEYFCLKDHLETFSNTNSSSSISYNNDAATNYTSIDFLKLGSNSNLVKNTNSPSSHITKYTNFNDFAGIRITSTYPGKDSTNYVLNKSGTLNDNGGTFIKMLKKITNDNGFPIELEFELDNKTQDKGYVNIHRLGYGNFIFIPSGQGYNYEYEGGNNNNPGTQSGVVEDFNFSKIYYKFLYGESDSENQDSRPGYNRVSTVSQFETRTVFILFPRRKIDTEFHIGLRRNRSNNTFTKECLAPIYRCHCNTNGEFRYGLITSCSDYSTKIDGVIPGNALDPLGGYVALAWNEGCNFELYPTVDIWEWKNDIKERKDDIDAGSGEILRPGHTSGEARLVGPYSGSGPSYDYGSENKIERIIQGQSDTKYIMQFCDNNLDT
jgi:hypothetical protein